jgi:hypothetical protein
LAPDFAVSRLVPPHRFSFLWNRDVSKRPVFADSSHSASGQSFILHEGQLDEALEDDLPQWSPHESQAFRTFIESGPTPGR